ncbi:MAG: hypothetical protein L3J22_06055 [Xanthomonadales bacterium]|nr:hypothetical protein [Xanthomonadales bacterium]
MMCIKKSKLLAIILTFFSCVIVTSHSLAASELGLILHWDFDAVTDNTVSDISGNGNDGTFSDDDSNDPELNPGILGQAITFDDTNKEKIRVVVDNFPSQELSFAVWVRSTDNNGGSTIISYRSPDRSSSLFKVLGVNGLGVLINSQFIRPNFGTEDEPVYIEFGGGQWHHLVVSWSRRNGVITIYKDGIEEYQGIDISRTTAIPTAGVITVGVDAQRWSTAWNGAYGGDMDDLRIYNRLLSQDEITWLASATPLNDNQPPSAPTALQAVAVSQTEAYLHWTSPADNEFVAGYRVYRDNNLIGTTGDTSFVDYAMNPGATHSYKVVAFDGASNNSSASMEVTVQAPNSGSVMDILPAGHWYEVQNSSVWTQLGVKPDVMGSWSGGVYDTNRERLVIWGGGHLNYDGNELYAFDFNTFNWMQLTKTTPKDQRVKSVQVYDDGMPTSVHTYDGLQYLPTLDKFFASGGSIWGSGGCSGGTWLYDFNAVPAESGWVDIADDKAGCGMYSAYDSATGNIWYGSWGNLYEFNPLNLSSPWTTRINGTAAESFYRTAAIDPNRRKMVVLGGLSGGSPETVIYDISNANAVTGGVVTTNGATEIENSNAAGFEFDPTSDKFVAWSGGNQVYTLATDSLKWSRIEPESTNLITPSIPAFRGTYGRFRYVPSKNVFVVVNGMQQNMFIYKLSANN